ncbi:CHASE domain-containing protein, partial [Acinetobacter baumannii]
NEKAIGLNLLSNPEQKTEATISRDSRELTLAGPCELVQGGQALAGRLPVFLKNAQGDSTFWGFTEVVMRLPDVLRTAQLPHLST